MIYYVAHFHVCLLHLFELESDESQIMRTNGSLLIKWVFFATTKMSPKRKGFWNSHYLIVKLPKFGSNHNTQQYDINIFIFYELFDAKPSKMMS